jgi:hypothetical protein
MGVRRIHRGPENKKAAQSESHLATGLSGFARFAPSSGRNLRRTSVGSLHVYCTGEGKDQDFFRVEE